MTKRTLNTHELEIIAGGAVEIAQDDASPTQNKGGGDDPLNPGGNGGGASTGSGLDTDIFGQDNNL